MPCPICSKPTAAEFKPFCCERCQQVDLHRWFSGSYAVPTQESPEDAAVQSQAEDEE